VSTVTGPDYDAISFVIRSRYREDAIKELTDHPQTPTQILEDLGYDRIAHISSALQQMRDEGLVELLVDEDTKKGRIYGLTEKGQNVVDHLEATEQLEGSAR